jgi:uncharacterized membrane protein
VHGGGFYHPVKFALAPPKLPAHLHWFYWESYSTWLSGFALFTVSYLWNAGAYLVDRSRMDWPPAAAAAAALGLLVVFWLLYDAVCRLFGQRTFRWAAPRKVGPLGGQRTTRSEERGGIVVHGDAVVAALVALLVGAASWLACEWFAGRAAFLLVGAMMATAMSANVLFWIIPGQRKMVAAVREGRPVDAIHGIRGKQRSVHNTYFTLPVLFAMLSNHYSFLWDRPRNWLVLLAMMLAGAAIRQFFVLRHGWKLGRNRHPLPYALAGVAVIAAVAVWLVPVPLASAPAAPAAVGSAQVRQVIEQRCLMCHGAQVQMKNVRLDTADGLARHAAAVHQQVVVTRLMPMNNSTGMTEAERALVGQWFRQGARVD